MLRNGRADFRSNGSRIDRPCGAAPRTGPADRPAHRILRRRKRAEILPQAQHRSHRFHRPRLSGPVARNPGLSPRHLRDGRPKDTRSTHTLDRRHPRGHTLRPDHVPQTRRTPVRTGSPPCCRQRPGIRHRRGRPPRCFGRPGSHRRRIAMPVARNHAYPTFSPCPRYARSRRRPRYRAAQPDPPERHRLHRPQPDHRRLECRHMGRRVARERRIAPYGPLRRRVQPTVRRPAPTA